MVSKQFRIIAYLKTSKTLKELPGHKMPSERYLFIRFRGQTIGQAKNCKKDHRTNTIATNFVREQLNRLNTIDISVVALVVCRMVDELNLLEGLNCSIPLLLSSSFIFSPSNLWIHIQTFPAMLLTSPIDTKRKCYALPTSASFSIFYFKFPWFN